MPRYGPHSPYGPTPPPSARRASFSLRLVPPEYPPGVLRRPARATRAPIVRTPAAESAVVAEALAERAAATSIPLGGPTAEERARHLRAAFDATGDAGQRLLIGEIMDHFKAWCEAHDLGDPFVNY